MVAARCRLLHCAELLWQCNRLGRVPKPELTQEYRRLRAWWDCLNPGLRGSIMRYARAWSEEEVPL